MKEAAKVLGVGAPVLQANPLLMQENKKRDLNKKIDIIVEETDEIEYESNNGHRSALSSNQSCS